MKTLASALLLTFCLAGCSLPLPTHQPQSFRYYVLNIPTPVRAQPVSGPRLGVVPVTLPGYLNRPQIVTRDTDNVNIRVNDFDRWGEELGTGVSRLLCESLTAHGHPAISLRTGAHVDNRLLLEVLRFDGTPGKTVILDAIWTIQKQGTILHTGHVIIEEDAGDDLESMVQAQSKLIFELGAAIDRALH